MSRIDLRSWIVVQAPSPHCILEQVADGLDAAALYDEPGRRQVPKVAPDALVNLAKVLRVRRRQDASELASLKRTCTLFAGEDIDNAYLVFFGSTFFTKAESAMAPLGSATIRLPAAKNRMVTLVCPLVEAADSTARWAAGPRANALRVRTVRACSSLRSSLRRTFST